MLHIHECPECCGDFECEDEKCCTNALTEAYKLEKVCKDCKVELHEE